LASTFATGWISYVTRRLIVGFPTSGTELSLKFSIQSKFTNYSFAYLFKL